MNLTSFAPSEFKEHLRVLDNMAKFNSARLRCELGLSSNHQHYLLIGNEGVGKSDAVQEIYNRLEKACGLTNCVVNDAVSLLPATANASESIQEPVKLPCS